MKDTSGAVTPTVDVTKSISLGKTKKSISVGGKTVDIDLAGSIDAHAFMTFKPDFDLGLQIDWFNVKEFHAIATGQFAAVSNPAAVENFTAATGWTLER